MVNTSKRLVWLLEEATPDVAQLMYQIERTAAGQAVVRRVTYTEALKELPRESANGSLTTIVVFSIANLQNLSSLVKSLPAPQPRLCFWAPTFEAMAELREGQRWPESVCAVSRHSGEAATLESAGFRPDSITTLLADIIPTALVEGDEPSGRPLRIGVAWYNLAPPQREAVCSEIGRWIQRKPEHCEWYLFFLPGDEPPDTLPAAVRICGLTPQAAAVETPLSLDVWLSDPWWPEAFPRPWHAPVIIPLAPGGVVGKANWSETLQSLLELESPHIWHEDLLWGWSQQPVWRTLLSPVPLTAGDPPSRQEKTLTTEQWAPLAAERNRWQEWLQQARQAWPHRLEEEFFDSELAYYFWLYDYRVEVSWCLDLWTSLGAARNGERHALLLALNALRLHHTGGSWLFKRLLANTMLGRPPASPRRLGKRFWLKFALKSPMALLNCALVLWQTGRDPEADPLSAGREVARVFLQSANISIVRRNEPAPSEDVPTIYLVSHRHGDYDPFLLLNSLPGALAVVVGPRAQRWPLIHRLAYSSSFVLTGRERGVVIADAISSVRARRALALYSEVTEPSYLGEGAPVRSGLLWIVQALEQCQVIPVLLDDAFVVGAEGGELDLWFGPPVLCTPSNSHTLLNRIRMFFHRHVKRINQLDEGDYREEAIKAPV
ncbi:MAG: hypothetical protein VKN33_00175 [Candidatus Sericytochromatia bacterium]|nr:hypothetical protein [Candidatus Sericytochromatia bacterium]